MLVVPNFLQEEFICSLIGSKGTSSIVEQEGMSFGMYAVSREHGRKLANLCKSYLICLGNEESHIKDKPFEVANIKRYGVGDGMDWHVDNGADEVRTRTTGFLFYLNDGFEGGETNFDGEVVVPSKGSCVIFDPSVIHKAEKVIAGEKWVLTCYLHF